MRRLLLSALAWLALAVSPAGAAGDLLAPTSVCPVTSSTQLLCLHNYARAKSGVPPLRGDRRLYASARAKSARIVACGVFTHYPCGDPFVPPAGFGWFGENLAYGYPTIRATFQSWLGSPGHRTNLLNPAYTLYGSGLATGGALAPLWTVQFGRPTPPFRGAPINGA